MKKTSALPLSATTPLTSPEPTPAKPHPKKAPLGRPPVKHPLVRLSVGLSAKHVELITADIEAAASQGQTLTFSEVIRRAIHAHYKVENKR